MYIVKLYVLRWLMVIATFLLSKVGSKKMQFKWLHHFLRGTGTPLTVPEHIVEEANSAYVSGIRRYHDDWGYNGKPSICGTYFVSHSLDYEGFGFANRPALFYLVGCHKFVVSGQKDNWHISAVDEYDWHCASTSPDGSKNYFCSPFGENPFIKRVFAILGKIFGEDLFVASCWPSSPECCGISNKLWEECYKVGAKSFNTYIECSPAKGGKLNNELNRLNEEKHKFFFERRLVDMGFDYERFYLIKKIEAVCKIPATSRATALLREVEMRKEQILYAIQHRDDEALYRLLDKCLHNRKL